MWNPELGYLKNIVGKKQSGDTQKSTSPFILKKFATIHHAKGKDLGINTMQEFLSCEINKYTGMVIMWHLTKFHQDKNVGKLIIPCYHIKNVLTIATKDFLIAIFSPILYFSYSEIMEFYYSFHRNVNNSIYRAHPREKTEQRKKIYSNADALS